MSVKKKMSPKREVVDESRVHKKKKCKMSKEELFRSLWEKFNLVQYSYEDLEKSYEERESKEGRGLRKKKKSS